MRLKAARFGCYAALWIFFGAAFKGDSALCGARPEALPLDSAAFEKAGETFKGGPREASRKTDH